MRCNQVSISIERFGKYVPKGYPADVQRIHVYCDDFNSVYAALSKAYAMAVNELNEYEQIGARTDVYTNEFSHVNYREMHGTIPVWKTRYEDDVNSQYYASRLEMCSDYVWAYEHIGELLETIKGCGEGDFAPALKERFGLNDVQIRKLSQMRLDMLTKEGYEAAKKEIVDIKAKIEDCNKPQGNMGMMQSYREWLRDAQREIDLLEMYFLVADHFEEIFQAMREAADDREFVKFMKERFDFSYEQSRAVRYASINDFYGKERTKKEERMQKLKEDRAMYERWIEEEELRMKNEQNKHI